MKSWLAKLKNTILSCLRVDLIMAKSHDIVETEHYELPLDFYLKCEFIAAQLEITVDYLLDEFYDDGQLIVPSFVEE